MSWNEFNSFFFFLFALFYFLCFSVLYSYFPPARKYQMQNEWFSLKKSLLKNRVFFSALFFLILMKNLLSRNENKVIFLHYSIQMKSLISIFLPTFPHFLFFFFFWYFLHIRFHLNLWFFFNKFENIYDYFPLRMLYVCVCAALNFQSCNEVSDKMIVEYCYVTGKHILFSKNFRRLINNLKFCFLSASPTKDGKKIFFMRFCFTNKIYLYGIKI